MSTFKTLEFGKIPSDWNSALLGREVDPVFTLVRNGLTISQDKNVGSYKITRIETISGGFIDESRVRFVSDVSEGTLEKFLIRKNDILFSHINSDAHIGKSAIATREYSDLLHGMNLLLLRPNLEVVDPYFLHLVFRFYRQLGVFIKICARAVNQSSINQERLRALEIPLPPLPEQRRIAHVLSTVQTAVEQQARLIALTRELKSSLMHKFFTEGLRGEKQKETEIGLVPESWDVLPLDELLTRTQYGLSVKGEDSGNYGILRMTNQFEGKISTDKLQFVKITQQDFDNYRLQQGDILFNRTNSLELVGRTAIFDNDGDYVFASYLIRLNTDEKRLNPFFLNHFLNWDESQKRLKSIALRAVSQSNISATRLRTFHVPVPPFEEQTAIITNIDTVIEMIELHRQKKQLLEELFRTLLHRLMTGQTRVNEIDLPGLS